MTERRFYGGEKGVVELTSEQWREWKDMDELMEKQEQLIVLLQAEIKDLKDELRELARAADAVLQASDAFEANARRLELGDILTKHDALTGGEE